MKKILMVVCLLLAVGTASADGWHQRRDDHDGSWGRGVIPGLLIGAWIGHTFEHDQYYRQPEYQRWWRPEYRYGPVYRYRPEYEDVPVYCIDRYGYQYVCQYRTVREYDDER